jgi:hypothetical protein
MGHVKNKGRSKSPGNKDELKESIWNVIIWLSPEER